MTGPECSSVPTDHERTKQEAERILLIRPSALGDVCRTVPVLAALKARYPSAAIDWLVQDSYAAAVEHHPALARAVLFPRARLAQYFKPVVSGEAVRFLRELARPRYQLVIDAQGLARSGVFALATRAPVRIGYADAKELAWLSLNQRVHAPRSMHTVDRMMSLAAAAGAAPATGPDLRLYADPAEVAAVRADARLEVGNYVLMAPTSRWPGKQWPPERYAEVAAALLDRHGPLGGGAFSAAVLVGSASERSQIRPLLDLAARDPRVIDLVGTTTVARLLALVREAALVIGNDSAVVHMAVGLDRPLIALYGPTHVARVGPYRREADVLQHVGPSETISHKDAKGGRVLMARISTAQVIERAVERASAGRPRLNPETGPAREPRSPGPGQARSGTSRA